MTYIGYASFYDCTKLESITIGKSIKTVREVAFVSTNLKDINIYASIPPETGYAFADFQATLHVPEESIDLYKSAPIWSEFKNIVGDLSGINNITVDCNLPTEIYDLKGMKVSEPIENLRKGIYIPPR